MNFEGEHLLPGQLGHLFVIISFIASLIATISFFTASRQQDLQLKKSWLRIARTSFFIQAVGVLAVFSVIFFICSNHYYEYMYVYKHASRELEYKYLLACIWEGQEGSFLLWTIWHGVLGSILIFRSKEWEPYVMTVISLAQFILTMMILGIYFGDIRIGNSPFTLTRNEIVAPIFQQANYLSFIKDGMGLNVLLRNYWMVIHPPILFLGFASTIVPFAYAYGGLQSGRFGEWIKPVLPWALFSALVLGVGIMMGGKWAYESLSFGGYWAWDPVENASLVPWLLLVAGLHTMVIYQATGNSLRSSFLFSILTFLFILYSTFLTRTGILGDTSVHAFTEAGSAINVMIGSLMFAFALPMLILFAIKYKKIPALQKEESMSSREFWMFMGSFTLCLSAFFIIAITSIPVYNKMPIVGDLIQKFHKGSLAMPEDPEFLYNKVMIMVAILLGLLTAFGQYLKYKTTSPGYLIKKIAIPTLISIFITSMVGVVYPMEFHKHGLGFLIAIYAGLFSTIYAVVANAGYIFLGLRGNMKAAGASIAHVGFALMLIGILISSSNKKVISDSRVNGINLAVGTDPMTRKQDDPTENLTLIRQLPSKMGEFNVTYRYDSAGHESGRKFYSLLFEKKDDRSGKIAESFILKPDIYLMKDNNMSSNPDTRSYLTRDIFTYVSYAVNNEKNEDTSKFRIVELSEGDSTFYNNGILILNKVLRNPDEARFKFNSTDAVLVADINIITKDSTRYHAQPYIQLDSFGMFQVDDTVYSQNLYLKFAGITDQKKIKIGIKESNKLIDFVTVKAFIFPYINLVWMGLIIMATGLIMSMIKRAKFKPIVGAIVLFIAIIALTYMFLLANG